MSPEIETKVLEKLNKMEKHSAEFEEKVLAKFDKMEKHSAEFEEKVLAKFDKMEKHSAEFEETVFTKFDQIDHRFDELDKKFIGIDKRFDEIDKKFIGIDNRFDELDKKIENKTDMIMNYLYQMSKTMTGMDDRLRNVESIVSQRWNLPEVSERVNALEYEVAKHTDRLNGHDRKLAALTG